MLMKIQFSAYRSLNSFGLSLPLVTSSRLQPFLAAFMSKNSCNPSYIIKSRGSKKLGKNGTVLLCPAMIPSFSPTPSFFCVIHSSFKNQTKLYLYVE